MIYEESHATRRIIGSLDPGQNLLEALQQICVEKKVSYGKIEVYGRLDTVELVSFDARTGNWYPVTNSTAEFEIVEMAASAITIYDQPTVQARALLSCHAPAGQQLVYGHVKNATVVFAEFVIEVPDDLRIRHKMNNQRQTYDIDSIAHLEIPSSLGQERATATHSQHSHHGLSESSYGHVAAAPSVPSTQSVSKNSVSWSDAVVATQNIKPPREREEFSLPKVEEVTPEDIYGDVDLDEPILGVGDTLIHKDLGRCRVVRLQDDEFAHVRVPRGKIRKLKLSLLDVRFVEEDSSGKSVFEAVKRRG